MSQSPCKHPTTSPSTQCPSNNNHTTNTSTTNITPTTTTETTNITTSTTASSITNPTLNNSANTGEVCSASYANSNLTNNPLTTLLIPPTHLPGIPSQQVTTIQLEDLNPQASKQCYLPNQHLLQNKIQEEEDKQNREEQHQNNQVEALQKRLITGTANKADNKTFNHNSHTSSFSSSFSPSLSKPFLPNFTPLIPPSPNETVSSSSPPSSSSSSSPSVRSHGTSLINNSDKHIPHPSSQPRYTNNIHNNNNSNANNNIIISGNNIVANKTDQCGNSVPLVLPSHQSIPANNNNNTSANKKINNATKYIETNKKNITQNNNNLTQDINNIKTCTTKGSATTLKPSTPTFTTTQNILMMDMSRTSRCQNDEKDDNYVINYSKNASSLGDVECQARDLSCKKNNNIVHNNINNNNNLIHNNINNNSSINKSYNSETLNSVIHNAVNTVVGNISKSLSNKVVNDTSNINKNNNKQNNNNVNINQNNIANNNTLKGIQNNFNNYYNNTQAINLNNNPQMTGATKNNFIANKHNFNNTDINKFSERKNKSINESINRINNAKLKINSHKTKKPGNNDALKTSPESSSSPPSSSSSSSLTTTTVHVCMQQQTQLQQQMIVSNNNSNNALQQNMINNKNVQKNIINNNNNPQQNLINNNVQQNIINNKQLTTYQQNFQSVNQQLTLQQFQQQQQQNLQLNSHITHNAQQSSSLIGMNDVKEQVMLASNQQDSSSQKIKTQQNLIHQQTAMQVQQPLLQQNMSVTSQQNMLATSQQNMLATSQQNMLVTPQQQLLSSQQQKQEQKIVDDKKVFQQQDINNNQTATTPTTNQATFSTLQSVQLTPQSTIISQSSSIISQSSTIIPQSSTILPQSSTVLNQSSTILPQSSNILPQSTTILNATQLFCSPDFNRNNMDLGNFMAQGANASQLMPQLQLVQTNQFMQQPCLQQPIIFHSLPALQTNALVQPQHQLQHNQLAFPQKPQQNSTTESHNKNQAILPASTQHQATQLNFQQQLQQQNFSMIRLAVAGSYALPQQQKQQSISVKSLATVYPQNSVVASNNTNNNNNNFISQKPILQKQQTQQQQPLVLGTLGMFPNNQNNATQQATIFQQQQQKSMATINQSPQYTLTNAGLRFTPYITNTGQLFNNQSVLNFGQFQVPIMNQQVLLAPQAGNTATLLGSQPLYIRPADPFNNQQTLVHPIQSVKNVANIAPQTPSRKTSEKGKGRNKLQNITKSPYVAISSSAVSATANVNTAVTSAALVTTTITTATVSTVNQSKSTPSVACGNVPSNTPSTTPSVDSALVPTPNQIHNVNNNETFKTSKNSVDVGEKPSDHVLSPLSQTLTTPSLTTLQSKQKIKIKGQSKKINKYNVMSTTETPLNNSPSNRMILQYKQELMKNQKSCKQQQPINLVNNQLPSQNNYETTVTNTSITFVSQDNTLHHDNQIFNTTSINNNLNNNTTLLNSNNPLPKNNNNQILNNNTTLFNNHTTNINNKTALINDTPQDTAGTEGSASEEEGGRLVIQMESSPTLPAKNTKRKKKGDKKKKSHPKVLTHIIEGFIIQEATEPFPMESADYCEKMLCEEVKEGVQHEDSSTEDEALEVVPSLKKAKLEPLLEPAAVTSVDQAPIPQLPPIPSQPVPQAVTLTTQSQHATQIAHDVVKPLTPQLIQPQHNQLNINASLSNNQQQYLDQQSCILKQQKVLPRQQPNKAQLQSSVSVVCEFCGKADYAHNFPSSKRFCSVSCSKRYSAYSQRYKQVADKGIVFKNGSKPPSMMSIVKGTKRPTKIPEVNNALATINNNNINNNSLNNINNSISNINNNNNTNNTLNNIDNNTNPPHVDTPTLVTPSITDSTPPSHTIKATIAASIHIPSSSNGFQSFATPKNHVNDDLAGVIYPDKALHQWSVDDVYNFVRTLPGCSMYAQEFQQQEIDGSALCLLKEEHLMTTLNVKLGPALKICAVVNSFKSE